MKRILCTDLQAPAAGYSGISRPLTLFIFYLLFLNPVNLQAQNPAHIIYDETQGLTTRQFYEVTQGADGNMYFACDLGLIRYDGEAFTLLPEDVHPYSQRRTNFFKVRPYEDKLLVLVYLNSLWLADGDTFTRFSPKEQIDRLPKTFLNNLSIDSAGRAMFSTFSTNGHWGYISMGDSIEISPCDDVDSGLAAIHFAPVTGTREWISYTCANGDGGAGQKLDPKKDLIQKSPEGYTISYFALFPQRKKVAKSLSRGLKVRNALWFSVNNALIKKELPDGREQRYKFEQRINTIDSMSDGTVLIGTNDGLFIMHPAHAGPEHVFRGHMITDCFEDNEGGLWITTHDRGVFYVPCLQVRRIDEPLPQNLSLVDMDVSDKWLAMVTAYEGFYGLRKQAGLWAGIHEPKQFYSRTNHIQFFSDDSIYIGASQMVLNTGYKEKLKARKVYDLFVWKGDLWTLTSPNTLSNISQGSSLDWSEEHMVCLNTSFNDSLLLIGTRNGLFAFDPDSEKFERYGPKTLQEKWIAELIRGESGELLVVTNNEAYWLSKQDSRGELIMASDPARHNNCGAFSSDSTCWIGSEDGLYHIKRDGSRFRTRFFGAPLGFSRGRVVDLAFRRDTLFVGTSNQVFYIDTRNIPNEVLAPLVSIRQIGLKDSLFEASVSISLAPNERDADFFFKAPTFRSAMDVTYAYRLVGYQDEWKMTTEDHASYFNLPPGTYRFEVKSKHGMQDWSMQQAGMSVIVTARLIEETWFQVSLIVLVFISLTLLMFLFFRQRDRQRAVELRSTQAELKSLSLEINPHFLYNALNTIHHLIGHQQLGKLDRFLGGLSRLTRSILEHSRQLLIPLATELQSLEDYLMLEQTRFGDRPFQFEIGVDEDIDPDKIFIPPLLIQPIVENALWHGLFPSTNDQKRLNIHCARNGESLVITITDNGVGRKASAEQVKPTGSGHTRSIGIKNTHERLKLFEQMGLGKGELTIADLYSATDQTTGTRATFIITPARKR